MEVEKMGKMEGDKNEDSGVKLGGFFYGGMVKNWWWRKKRLGFFFW